MKKLFTLFLIITAFSAEADYWTQKASYAGGIRWGAVGFSIGTKGYVGTGDSTFGIAGMTQDFWEYNSLTNVWTAKANFGGMARMAAVGFSINSKGYIGCGRISNGNYVKDFWEYDAATNNWTQKADFGGVERYGAIGFSIGNKGYIGTGNNNNGFFKDFWQYDPLTNIWTPKSNFGGTDRSVSVGFTNGLKGYLGTGTDANTYPGGKNDFWEWDPNSNVWTQKANFSGLPRSEGCAFWICPYGYIGLGTASIVTATLSDFKKYNIATNTWLQAAAFGGGLREMAAAFSIGQKAYVGTGWINDANPHSDFWEYTPDSTCATGIEEIENSNFDFQISPNPAHQYANISWSSSENENAELLITTLEGKKVYETKLFAKANPSFGGLTSDFRLSTSDFPKGIYLVELNNGKEKMVKKFLKE